MLKDQSLKKTRTLLSPDMCSSVFSSYLCQFCVPCFRECPDQEWPRQTKPKKGRFMNFSQGHSGTKVRYVNHACFPKESTRIHKKMGKIHMNFSFWPFAFERNTPPTNTPPLLVATAGKEGWPQGSCPVVFSMLMAPRIWEDHETGPQFSRDLSLLLICADFLGEGKWGRKKCRRIPKREGDWQDESQVVPFPEKLFKTRDLELPIFEGSLPSCPPHSAGYTRTFLRPYFPVAKFCVPCVRATPAPICSDVF